MSEQFKEWLFDDLKFLMKDFKTYPFAMQWGVYLEFFDSIGMIDIECSSTDYRIYNRYINKWIESGRISPRIKTQQEAIKKAFKIHETTKEPKEIT